MVEAHGAQAGALADPALAFREAAVAAGIPIKGSIRADGKLHRVDVEGDPRGSRNGYYVLHLDDHPAGLFGCWKRNFKQTWKAGGHRLTDFELARLREKVEADRLKREREEARKQAAAAKTAKELWAGYAPAPADHPYLQRKGVAAHGIRVDREGKLVLAMVDAKGAIWSLQTIDADGDKRFLPGGKVQGTMFAIGEPGPAVVIAEGYATAATIHQATGAQVIVAFNAGNLEPVARAVREARPDVRMLIAADNDCETHQPVENPGVHYARRAARAAGAAMAVPSWPEDHAKAGRKADWNDLAQALGEDPVADPIFEAIPPGIMAHDEPEEIEEAPPHPGFDGDGYDQPPPADTETGDPGLPIRGGKPVIQIMGGTLAKNSDEAEVVLGNDTRARPFSGVYVNGAILVRPMRLAEAEKSGGVTRQAGSLMLVPVTANFLRRRLTELCAFLKWDGRAEDWVPADCTDALAKSVMEGAPWPSIPRIEGVIEAPTMREDGTILDQPGYDEATGLLFDPGGIDFPRVPEKPTRAQAEAALQELIEVIYNFPFENGAARSVMLAAMLTCVIRRTLRAAPMFAFSAPKPGSGKTLLAECIGYLATGRPPVIVSQPNDPDEERKRMLGLLMDGTAVLLIDNVERPIQSDVLCSILSQPTYSDRVLGGNIKAIARTNLTIMSSGNNTEVLGDLTRRTLRCYLDPNCDRPEEREFDVNLHEFVPANRARLVVAVLTIIRAHMEANSPNPGLPNYGNFEQWAARVRLPLVWLGQEDPVQTREGIEARDETKEKHKALLECWSELFGSEPMTVGAVIKVDGDGDRYVRWHEILGEFKVRGEMNVKSFGKFIASREKRNEGGLRFERAGVAHHAVQWRVVSSANSHD
jgi:putative DNA primase/helicase